MENGGGIGKGCSEYGCVDKLYTGIQHVYIESFAYVYFTQLSFSS
jgi:hypothetical protein